MILSLIKPLITPPLLLYTEPCETTSPAPCCDFRSCASIAESRTGDISHATQRLNHRRSIIYHALPNSTLVIFHCRLWGLFTYSATRIKNVKVLNTRPQIYGTWGFAGGANAASEDADDERLQPPSEKIKIYSLSLFSCCVWELITWENVIRNNNASKFQLRSFFTEWRAGIIAQNSHLEQAVYWCAKSRTNSWE